MPLFQSRAGSPPEILTKDGGRIIAYTLTPTATKRLREIGVRHGRTVPSRVLASLIRTGDAHSPRPADHAGQISLFGDDDTANQLPRCELTGATSDLHLIVYGEGSGIVAKLASPEPRFVLQKVTTASIPIAALSPGTLDLLEMVGKLPQGSNAARVLRQWFRRDFEGGWEKLRASPVRQDHLDLGSPADELPLSEQKPPA